MAQIGHSHMAATFREPQLTLGKNRYKLSATGVTGMIRDSRLTGCLTLLLAAALALLNPGVARPQANTATLHGTVTDPSGAVISSAKITLTNEGTRAATTQAAGSGGEYVFPFVPPASYSLQI